MWCECVYDPMADLCEVSPFGYVDIVKMNATSSLDVPLGDSQGSYNGVEDPRSLGDRPSDVFEAMQAGRAVQDYSAPKKDE